MLTDRANTICLYRILFEHSDENHILSMRNIIDCFAEEYDMKIDRRTVYSSVDTLKDLGYDISAYDENGKLLPEVKASESCGCQAFKRCFVFALLCAE